VLKVLVVDDSLAVQRSLGRLLDAVAGVSVVGYAESLARAQQLIGALMPDVIVLDVDLEGGQRGIELLLYVAREHPAIQVIGLSNFTWRTVHDCRLAAGASACFDKSTEFHQARDWIVARTKAAHHDH